MGFWPEWPDLANTLRTDIESKRDAAEEALEKAKATVLGALGGQLIEAGTLTETIRTGGDYLLRLTQRPVNAITSITLDDTLLDAGDYEIVDARAGTVERLTAGFGYRDSRAVVVYDYGFDELPGDLRNVVLASAVREFENPRGKQSNSGENYGTVTWRLFPGELSRTEQAVVARYTGTPSGRLAPPRRDRLFG